VVIWNPLGDELSPKWIPEPILCGVCYEKSMLSFKRREEGMMIFNFL